MEFGVPSKKRVKEEKHPDVAVITLHPYEGAKTSRKMEFNKKAYEVLGLTPDEYNHVAFSFNKADMTQNYLVNVEGKGLEDALKIAKNGVLSNKAHYNEIKSRYKSSKTETLELTLIDSGRKYDDRTVFALVTLDSLDKAGDDTEKLKEAMKDDSPKLQKVEDSVPENKSEDEPAKENVESGSSISAPVKESDILNDDDDLLSEGTDEVKENVQPETEEEEEDDLPF